MNIVTAKLLELAIPLVSAPLAFWLTQQAKRANLWMDSQSAIIKQALALATSTVLNIVVPIIGAPMCPPDSGVCTIGNLDYKVLVTWALAMAIHGMRRNNTSAPSISVPPNASA